MTYCDEQRTSEDSSGTQCTQVSAVPFADVNVTISKLEYIQLKADAQYYKTLHERSIKREEQLKRQIEKQKAQVLDLQQRLYGRRSEKSKGSSEKQTPDRARGVRGQKEGRPGHGRTSLPNLPVVERVVDLDEDSKTCPDCNKPLIALDITHDSDTIEIEVKAFVRRVKRKCYRTNCQCKARPRIISAATVPTIVPKGKLGISCWVELLLDKYHYMRPTNRLLQSWNTLGLTVSQGTVIGGLKQIAPLFEPLLEQFRTRQMTDAFFHADETTWRVFEEVEGKVGTRWYLWLFRSLSVCFYILDPSRAATVPLAHFATALKSAIVVCDRYCAYKKMSRILGMLLAFCWAHVRRDFLELGRGYPQLQPWATMWVERIGTLYHLNAQRHAAEKDSAEFVLCQANLSAHLALMVTARDQFLADSTLHPMAKKCLESLKNHWTGLTIFAAHPEIAMDNNSAEQGLRNAVCGRKAFYGSGSQWAGQFAVMMFTLFMTLVHCWKINPRLWLCEYLQACAAHGARAPHDLSSFLPWEMDAQRLAFMRGAVPSPNVAADTS